MKIKSQNLAHAKAVCIPAKPQTAATQLRFLAVTGFRAAGKRYYG